MKFSSKENEYLEALEEDCTRLEGAAKELHKQLSAALKVIKKFETKYRHQKKLTQLAEADLAAARRQARDVANLSTEQSTDAAAVAAGLYGRHALVSTQPALPTCAERILKADLARLEDTVREQEATIAHLHTLIPAPASPTMVVTATHDERSSIAHLKRRVRDLEEDLRIEMQNTNRFSELFQHECCDPFSIESKPRTEVPSGGPTRSRSVPYEKGVHNDSTNDHTSFLTDLTPRQKKEERFVYLARNIMKVPEESASISGSGSRLFLQDSPREGRNPDRRGGVGHMSGGGVVAQRTFDRPIVRSREADYWIPEAVFRYTTEFRNTHFPRADTALFYEYLYRCNVVWRCAHKRAVGVLQKKHSEEVASLKRRAQKRSRRIDEISRAIDLGDLEREIERLEGLPKGAARTSKERLVVAVSQVQNLASGFAALEFENDRLRKLTDPDAQREGLVRRFQKLLSSLDTAISAKCHDFQTLIDAKHSHLSLSTNAAMGSIMSSVTQFSQNLLASME